MINLRCFKISKRAATAVCVFLFTLSAAASFASAQKFEKPKPTGDLRNPAEREEECVAKVSGSLHQ